MYGRYIPPEEIDFSDNDETFKEFCYKEVVIDGVYEPFHRVRNGDIVVDFGANIGLFPCSLHDRKPERVICLEPSYKIFGALQRNLEHLSFPTVALNCAISSKSETKPTSVLHDGVKEEWIYACEDQSEYDTKSLTDILKYLSIDRIDFLKTDCEGGEYDLFSPENYEFMTNRVRYVAGEWHISGLPNGLEKFLQFREMYLKNRTGFRVFEPWHSKAPFSWGTPPGWKEITNEIMGDGFPEGFLNYWGPQDAQLMIYIDNIKYAN